MGKASRRQRQDRIRVDDAARLMSTAMEVASWGGTARGRPRFSQVEQWVGQIAQAILGRWDLERVVVRADPDLLGALLDSDLEADLPADWAQRLPYCSLGVSLVEPLELVDGTGRRCRYLGFLAAGMRRGPMPPAWQTRGMVPPPAGAVSTEKVFTRYDADLEDIDGFRFLWVFVDDEGVPGAETITVSVGGERSANTVAEMVDHAAAGHRALGSTGEADVGVLGPAAILTMLYLSSTEPDLDRLPPEQVSRPQQLSKTELFNLGWRVGGAIRSYRTSSADGPDDDRRTGPSGWRLPPHIRSAHFRRSRVATRNDDGVIVGDVQGNAGVDWHYVLRWIPPTGVNVSADGPAPVVRDSA